MSKNITITNKTRGKLPSGIFEAIKKSVLGSDYELSLIFTTSEHIKKLNTMYRNIEKPTDILSFPLSKNNGEIYICPSETKKEAPKFDRAYKNFLIFIFIHGCVHLKGYDHGSTMESIEENIRKEFAV